MKQLVRLYPRGWRERYGEEYTQLLSDLESPRRWWLAVDIGRGALDAHFRGRYGMRRFFTDPAIRRGVYDGLIVAGLLAILVVLTNVVFPGGPDESDGDPEYVWRYLATLAGLAALLVTIGVRGRRRAGVVAGGVKAGAMAGAVIGAMVTLTFLVMNNIWLDIVSRQHDKRVAFASSGWTSMRAYLTVTQLEGGLVLVPVLAVVGGALGLLGAALIRSSTVHSRQT
jgi:hypothetical protein